jgi:predicted ATP-grasp superfamily ATP-dependent carboligase
MTAEYSRPVEQFGLFKVFVTDTAYGSRKRLFNLSSQLPSWKNVRPLGECWVVTVMFDKGNKMKRQAVVIISGYNIRAVVAFCRWAAANSVNFHIIAKNNEDPIFRTAYKNHVSFTRDSPKLFPEFFRFWIASLCDKYSYDNIVILPSTEYLNRFLLEKRNLIESKKCTLPLVSEKLYTAISDKYSFAKLCHSYGFSVPEEFDQIPEHPPFVAKPRSYFSEEGAQLDPCLIHDRMDLENFRTTENESDYFYQKFISGRSIYLLAYIGKNGPDNTIIFSQENLMQQARGGSIILAKASQFHEAEIAKQYITMLQQEQFFGLVMIEVREETSSGRYYMIEANPRLWGPMQFCVDNNVDLFGAMLRDCGFEIPKTPSSPIATTYYFWSGGITHQSLPIAYHCYTRTAFANDFHRLKTEDIFPRKDTIALHLEDLSSEGDYV